MKSKKGDRVEISKLWEGDEQDREIENVQKIMAFRKVLFDYAAKSDSDEAKKLAALTAFALFGAAHNYKACCVLFFVENIFYDRPNPKTLCPVDKRVLCRKCQNDLASWILDTGF